MRYSYKKALKAKNMDDRLMISEDLHAQVSRIVRTKVDAYEIIKSGEFYIPEYVGFNGGHFLVIKVTRRNIYINFDTYEFLGNTEKDIFESKVDTRALGVIATQLRRV